MISCSKKPRLVGMVNNMARPSGSCWLRATATAILRRMTTPHLFQVHIRPTRARQVVNFESIHKTGCFRQRKSIYIYRFLDYFCFLSPPLKGLGHLRHLVLHFYPVVSLHPTARDPRPCTAMALDMGICAAWPTTPSSGPIHRRFQRVT